MAGRGDFGSVVLPKGPSMATWKAGGRANVSWGPRYNHGGTRFKQLRRACLYIYWVKGWLELGGRGRGGGVEGLWVSRVLSHLHVPFDITALATMQIQCIPMYAFPCMRFHGRRLQLPSLPSGLAAH